jgi:hypothetical protein
MSGDASIAVIYTTGSRVVEHSHVTLAEIPLGREHAAPPRRTRQDMIFTRMCDFLV